MAEVYVIERIRIVGDRSSHYKGGLLLRLESPSSLNEFQSVNVITVPGLSLVTH